MRRARRFEGRDEEKNRNTRRDCEDGGVTASRCDFARVNLRLHPYLSEARRCPAFPLTDLEQNVKSHSPGDLVQHMANDRALGGAILGVSILGIIVYGVLLYFASTIVLEITAFLAVVILLGILAWIGWTMATTPPPEPITETPPPPPAPAPPAEAPAQQPSDTTASEKKEAPVSGSPA